MREQKRYGLATQKGGSVSQSVSESFFRHLFGKSKSRLQQTTGPFRKEFKNGPNTFHSPQQYWQMVIFSCLRHLVGRASIVHSFRTITPSLQTVPTLVAGWTQSVDSLLFLFPADDVTLCFRGPSINFVT